MEAYKMREPKREAVINHDEGFASTLLRQSPNPILLLEENTSIAYVNPAMERETGFTSVELLGTRAPYPWWTEDMMERFSTGLKKIGNAAFVVTKNERLFRAKEGRRFWVEISTSPVRLADGKRGFIATWVDITARKEAESKLRESEHTARALLDAFVDLAILVDLQGTILAVNRTGARRLGYTVQELIGSDLFLLLPPNTAQARKARFLKSARTGRPTHFEDDVGGRTFENDIYPVLDTKGKVVRLAVFARDITERKVIREHVRNTLSALTKAIPALVPLYQPYPFSKLTPRERIIAQALSEGNTTREISQNLGLSVKTVEVHRGHILEKLGVRNVIELTRLAIREGLVAA